MKTIICPHCGKPNKPILDIIRELIREEEMNFRKPVAVTLPKFAKDILEQEIKQFDLHFTPCPELNERTILGLSIISGSSIQVASCPRKVIP